MFKKKSVNDALTPEQRDQELALRASGSDDWGQQARTYCHLMFARHLVEHGRIGERPTEQLIRRATTTTGPRPRGAE